MFDPGALNEKNAAKAAQKKLSNSLKEKALTLIPPHFRDGLLIDVKEIVCGDPSCAPVDTVFELVWTTPVTKAVATPPSSSGASAPIPSLGKGMFGLPMRMAEITPQDLEDMFPDEETLAKWKDGKRCRWPPPPKIEEVRFKIGDRVECRIGAHPVKGWAPGRIVKLYYRESNWPDNMIAPYQIALHDGRLIFAPQDTDNVIRLRGPAAPDAPSSPDLSRYYNYAGPDDDDDEMVDEEDEEYEEYEEGDELPSRK